MVRKQMFIASVPTIILDFAVLRSIGNMARTIQSRRMGVKKRSKSYKTRAVKSVDRYVPESRARRVKTNVGSTIARCRYGMPDRFETTLVYTDSFILTPGVSAFAEKVYNMNGLYDPDVAVGGGQPYWFDQLTAIYNKYQVKYSKCIATFSYDRSSSSTASGPWIAGVSGDKDSTLASNSASILCSMQDTDYQAFGLNDPSQMCQGWYTPKKCLSLEYDDTDQGAGIGANPVKNWFAHVWVAPQGSSTTTVMNVLVRLEYRVVFSQLIDNAGS